MKAFLALLLLLSAVPAFCWVCPACGTANPGQICTRCSLPEVPPGMVYIPASTVVLDGDTIQVEPLFVDSDFSTYRQVLPWMNSTITTLQKLAEVVTGQYDSNLQFLRYTPFTGSSDGSGLTVPSGCFDLPVCSFTRIGATEYLLSTGKRLPTAAELAAAEQAGLVRRVDVYDLMATYSTILESTMGEMLGRLAGQAMFAGYSTADERVLWEWTSDSPAGRAAVEGPCATIYRPSGRGVAGVDCGYFNVTFRGAVTLPSTLASD